LGSDSKDLERYVVQRLGNERVDFERIYTLRSSSGRTRSRYRDDIINDIFEKGPGRHVNAYKVCLRTSIGDLKSVLLVKYDRTVFGQIQIRRRVVASYQIPVPLNPVYDEKFTTFNAWKLDVITGGTINGKSFSVNFSQPNNGFNQLNNSQLPLASCNY
jgi:hypothetical protein